MTDLDPVRSHCTQVLRQSANEAFRRGDFAEAAREYGRAIELSPEDATLFRNRSAAYSALKRHGEALSDALRAIRIAPAWPKGLFRLGTVYADLLAWQNAFKCFEAGLELEPTNKEMIAKASVARSMAQNDIAYMKAQSALEHRSSMVNIRKARQDEVRQGQEKQFRETMAAPDFELEDYDWRPTYFPNPSAVIGSSNAQGESHGAEVISSITSRLSDLASPTDALQILHDPVRLDAWESAILNSIDANSGCSALLLGHCTGVLALMTARAGAKKVVCVEQNSLLCRMSEQLISADGQLNLRVHNATNGTSTTAAAEARQNGDSTGFTLPGAQQPSLTHVTPEKQEAEAWLYDNLSAVQTNRAEVGEAGSNGKVPSCKADMVVTDLFDYRCLGMGLLESIGDAHSLLGSDALIVPCAVKIKVMAVEMQVGNVSGLDLSPMNKYLWSPGFAKVDMDRERYIPLSDVVEVKHLDLQTIVRDGCKPAEIFKQLSLLHVPITTIGRCNAIVCWFEVNTHGDFWVSSWGAAPGNAFPAARSWQQAVQYWDATPVTKGDFVLLEMSYRDGQLFFWCSQAGKGRPKHAAVPRWYFHMLADTKRNEAYECAIKRAMATQKAMQAEDIHVLDIGAGCGLLSMFAARAGATRVTGVEISGHICDTAWETLVLNGFAQRCTMINKDIRRVTVAPSANGIADLPGRAALCVFEVFDSGLIGEGVLHMLQWAKKQLLQPNAVLIPQSAELWCMLVDWHVPDSRGFSSAACEAWQYRPNYEAIGLHSRQDCWSALCSPVKFMSFDFYDMEGELQPASVPLSVPITADGMCNAIVFWFDLHLDEETVVSTDPQRSPKASWEQAIQWFPAGLKVKAGTTVSVTAEHDTYGMRFTADFGDQAKNVDERWLATYQRIRDVHSQIAAACTQNPRIYRNTAIAAINHARRHPSPQAIDFCTKLMR